MEKVGASPWEGFWPILLGRLLSLYFAFVLVTLIFSDWRHFPSVGSSVAFENLGKFFLYVVFVGAPYLLLSQALSVVVYPKAKIGHLLLADLLFVALYLLEPVTFLFKLLMSLGSAGSSSVSIGVSEGAIMTDGVVTELGKRYYFMNTMKDALDMAIYIVMRSALFRLWSFRKS